MATGSAGNRRPRRLAPRDTAVDESADAPPSGRRAPRSGILPAALAGTLWMSRPRKRWSGAIMSLLTIVPLLFMLPAVARPMIGDPFLQPTATFASRPIQLAPIASVAVPDNASSLHLSRDGSRFMVDIEEYDDEGWGRDDRRFVVGDFAGHQKQIVAVDAAFIDDSRLMVLSRAGTRLDAQRLLRRLPARIRCGKRRWTSAERRILTPMRCLDAGESAVARLNSCSVSKGRALSCRSERNGQSPRRCGDGSGSALERARPSRGESTRRLEDSG